MKPPRISVVLPVLNQAKYLERALESILGQGYPETECIVIDGGSSDGSADIVRSFGDRLAYWVSEPDKGQSHAVNKGFSRCTGELVTFFHADDEYMPGAFSDAAEQYVRHPDAGVYAGAFRFIDEESRPLSGFIVPYLRRPAPTDLTLGPPGAYRLHQAALFYSRAALEEAGMYVREDLRYVMDRELLYRVLRRRRAVLTAVPYGSFRRHAESKSGKGGLAFALEFASIYESSCTGNAPDDARRRRMADYRKAVGYLRLAKEGGMRREAFRAAALYPPLCFSWSFLEAVFSFRKRSGGRAA
ncbi:MAG: glycosyltransferase family 2 protein [Bacteroidota bacterium]|nr:glycosyltransferase family 2 protein [Bacteroidota bacterium]